VARAIWSGSINFGLVTIPVKLYPAVRAAAEIHFHLLHAADEGRIHNERVCEVCGKKVAWHDLAKGYELDKGRYVVLSDEDLKKANVEATQSIEIVEFVDLAEIDPMVFDAPYYLEPDKKGRHAYALLRDALAKSGKVGIARVVLRTREHLAALRPSGRALVVDMMHWGDEMLDAGTLDLPEAREPVAGAEMRAAEMLIDALTKKLDLGELHDTYREQLQALIEARAEGKAAARGGKAKPPTNVRNLLDVLEKSLDQTKRGPAKARPGHRRHHGTAA
jgi:DNA end-binding protein Ku